MVLKVFFVLLIAVATGGAAFSPASPVSIDVERRQFAAGAEDSVALRAARMRLTPSQDAEGSIRLIRRMPWHHGTIGDSYEFRVIPESAVSPEHPATITLPLPAPLPPGSMTVVSFRDSRGWATHTAVVDAGGRTATAVVGHLSPWAAIDVARFTKALRALLEGMDIRTPKPPCEQAPGVLDVDAHDDPMAWVCVAEADGRARSVTIVANRGFPLVAQVEGPVTIVRHDGSGGLIEEIARPIYEQRKLLIVPPGSEVELRWDGSADGEVRLASETVTVFVRAVLTLLTSARATAAEVAGAVIAAVDCLLTAPDSLVDAWQPCLGTIAGVADIADLRHGGLRLAGEALGVVLKLLGLAGGLDLLAEKALRDGDPVLTHLRAPTRLLPKARRAPAPAPSAAPASNGVAGQHTGGGAPPAGADLVFVTVNGCH